MKAQTAKSQAPTISALIAALDDVAAVPDNEGADAAAVAEILREIIGAAAEEELPRHNHVKVDPGHAQWLEQYLLHKGEWVTTQHLLEVSGWDVRYLRAVASSVDAISSSEHGGYIAFDLAPPAKIERYIATQTARAEGNYDRARRMRRRLAKRLSEEP